MNPVLADVLAYLDKRYAAYAAHAAKHPDAVDDARSMQRHLLVIAGDLRAGLHEGMAGESGAATPAPAPAHTDAGAGDMR